MYSLLIETSTKRGVVAIFEQDVLIVEKHLPFGFQNSSHLLPALETLLNDLALSANRFSLVIAGVGPGSYTGIRAGCIVAKAFAYAESIPLVGVCSLSAFVPEQEGPFVSLVDAKSGGVYVQKGERRSGQVYWQEGPALVPVEELPKVPLLIGPEPSLVAERVEKRQDWQWQEVLPDAKELFRLGKEKFERGFFSKKACLDLLYLR